MQLEIGTILEGTVNRVAAFGAFVTLADRQSGMVHISELSYRYVKDINDAVKVGDRLRVKVIACDERGRISLSVKQAMTQEEIAREKALDEAARAEARRARSDSQKKAAQPDFSKNPVEYTPFVRNDSGRGGSGSASASAANAAEDSGTDARFEEMLTRFKRVSDEKISDLHKYTEGRGNSQRRKR